MVNNFARCRRMIAGVAVIVAVSLSLSACEPLRKKFTRQKKKDQSEVKDFIPVLEPQEYLAPENNPVENYKQHYNLIKAWYKDLWTVVEERGSDKRAAYTIKQIYGHIEEMQKLVVSSKQDGLARLKKLLQYYNDSLNNSRPLRNMSRIQSDLRAFDRQLRQINAGKVKGDFVPVKK
ncbi:MAG: hypothetical protein HY591_06810 [Candidatus Omnitrophica bacterium]|nr:hypothetical protein [Candidatus Omnitrophota bacterium]